MTALYALAFGTALAATPEEQAAAHWAGLALADVEAAHSLLAENHPGAVPELGDADFLARFERGTALARERAARVTDYFGHRAVLQGYATAFGDAHIWTTSVIRGARYAWAGLVVVREGGAFVVSSDERPGGTHALVGATLTGCDGRSADDLSAERLGGFRADPTIEAQVIEASPWLLVDDGNPFLGRPAVCTFEVGDSRVDVPLAWSQVEPGTLQEHLSSAVARTRASAGFGVRPFPGGWWIALERLDEGAAPVLAEVRAKAEQIREAPMVVVDVRGNGGGDSAYGRELLVALMGDRAKAKVDAAGRADCVATWRASAGNLAAVRAFREGRGGSQNADTQRYYAALEAAMASAVAAGRPFEEELAPCAAEPPPPPRKQVKSDLRGRLVLLTDHACFSSCLIVAAQVRAVGGLHVGEATDAATRYMEVREITLPSGLATFTTLQKVDLGTPARLGPFVPSYRFPGALSDTAALEAWITGLPPAASVK